MSKKLVNYSACEALFESNKIPMTSYFSCLNQNGGVYFEAFRILLNLLFMYWAFCLFLETLQVTNPRSLYRTSLLLKKLIKYKIRSLKFLFVLRLIYMLIIVSIGNYAGIALNQLLSNIL